MDIFESLENLQVSEACFEDIIGLVEEHINERSEVNKIKKNGYENNLAGINNEYKDNVQNKIKGLKKDADDYYWASVDAADATQKGHDASKKLSNISDLKLIQANRLRRNLSKRFVNREGSI